MAPHRTAFVEPGELPDQWTRESVTPARLYSGARRPGRVCKALTRVTLGTLAAAAEATDQP